MFSFVLFLLHRHVLGRSLEHPHARIQSRMHRSVHRVVCLVLARRLHSSQHTVVLVELGGGGKRWRCVIESRGPRHTLWILSQGHNELCGDELRADKIELFIW